MTNFANEEWRTIPGFTHHSVSNFGRIRSDDHQTLNKGSGHITKYSGKILKTTKHKFGYPAVTIYQDGKFHTILVHVAVALAFIGPRPKGMEIRHLDSNPLNNRPENLCYGTKSENMQDAVKNGTLVFSRTKLSRDDIINIARDKRRIGEIAKSFQTCTATICNIKSGKSFKNFTKEIFYKKRNRRKFSEEEIKKILDKSKTRKEIANELGISFHTVKRIRKINKSV